MGDNTSELVVRYARRLGTSGLSPGTAGNLSVIDRPKDRVYLTPSGVAYDELETPDVSVIDGQGNHLGGKSPSSEWHLHTSIYRARVDIVAIVHTHSTFATALACCRQEIPPFHYMVMAFGGDSIPVAPYETFGTRELADAVTQALGDSGTAALMANHGAVVLGGDLAEAFANAELLESLAEQYCRARGLGNVQLLTAKQIGDVREKIQGYMRRKH